MDRKNAIILTTLLLLSSALLTQVALGSPLKNGEQNSPWDQLLAMITGHNDRITELEAQILALQTQIDELETPTGSNTPDYDSGWIDATGELYTEITHGLNSEDLHVEVYARASPTDLPHQRFYGATIYSSTTMGYFWYQTDLDTLVVEKSSQPDYNFIRVVIWELPATEPVEYEPKLEVRGFVEAIGPGGPETLYLHPDATQFIYTGYSLHVAVGFETTEYHVEAPITWMWTVTYSDGTVETATSKYVELDLLKLGDVTVTITVDAPNVDPVTQVYTINLI